MWDLVKEFKIFVEDLLSTTENGLRLEAMLNFLQAMVNVNL